MTHSSRLLTIAAMAAITLNPLWSQPKPEPKAIFSAVATSLDSLSAIRANVRIVFKSVTDAEYDTSWFNALVAVQDRSTLVRLVYRDGPIASYDGTSGYFVDSARRVLRISDSTMHPEENIGREIRSLMNPKWATGISERASAMVYEGLDTVVGAVCHRMLVRYPNSGDFSNMWSRFWIDTARMLPLQRASSVDFYGGTQYQEILLETLEINPAWSRDAFTLDAAIADSVVRQSADAGPPPPPPLAVGTEAPPWRLVDGNGDTIALGDFRGKIVVLDFWGTWCGWCKLVMPDVQKLHQTFKGQPVEVIGIAVENNPRADPRAYMQTKGYTYRLAIGNNDVARDYHVNGYPTMFVIGTDGKIVHVLDGADPKGHLKAETKIIRTLLKSRRKAR